MTAAASSMTEMVRDHEKTLKDLQQASKNAKDPQFKAFADKTQTAVSQHLDQARKISDQVGGNRGGRNNKSAAATGTTPTDANSGSNAKSSAKSDANTGASTSSTQRDTPAAKDDNKHDTKH